MYLDVPMANEATIIELFNGGRPMRFTVADSGAIAKGTLMEMSGDRLIIANTNADKYFAGVAAFEKVTLDGSTELTVYTDGIFDMVSDAGTDVVGSLMALSATENIIQTGDATDLIQGSHVGYYLEAGTNGGTEAVRVNC